MPVTALEHVLCAEPHWHTIDFFSDLHLDSTQPATLPEAQGHADLAARWARQELAQRHQVRVAFVVEPLASAYELLAEIAQMGCRATKRGETKLEKDQKNFKHTGFLTGRWR